MTDDKTMNIQMQVDAGSVVLVFNHPDDRIEIPLNPEVATELGYDLVEHAKTAREMEEE